MRRLRVLLLGCPVCSRHWRHVRYVGDSPSGIPFAEATCPVCACPQDAPAGWYERGPTDDCPDPSCPCHDYAAMVAP